jgi:hypothetical protein
MGVGQQFQCSWKHLQYGCRQQQGMWGREAAAEVPYREDLSDCCDYNWGSGLECGWGVWLGVSQHGV